ncbi:hypothetical protein AGJ41_21360, partial [Cronobacter dublinensis subsp. dublinensis]|nr:hypothetical protein [Cronobacter dublinensis subsp. dublinensis]
MAFFLVGQTAMSQLVLLLARKKQAPAGQGRAGAPAAPLPCRIRRFPAHVMLPILLLIFIVLPC